jgi:hypothetical protein
MPCNSGNTNTCIRLIICSLSFFARGGAAWHLPTALAQDALKVAKMTEAAESVRKRKFS